MDGRGFYSPYYYPQYNAAFYQNQPPHPQTSTSNNFLPMGATPVPNVNIQPSTSNVNTSSPTDGFVADNETESSIAKRVYEKWTDPEQKLLVNLWAENLERLESKDARKVWDEIAAKINKAFKSDRLVVKYKNKIKYLLDRYKKAKDWNMKQSGGHLRKSIFYDEFDEVLGCREIVALKHVEQAGSSASNNSTNASLSENEEATPKESTKDKRTERKKKRKSTAVDDETEEEERKFFKAAVSGQEAQRKDMSLFVENFNRIQTEQLNTMNTLVGAVAKFLEKQ